MTPLSLPDKWAPVIADAEIAGATAPALARCVGAVELIAVGLDSNVGRWAMGDEGTRTDGVSAGVECPDDDGDGASTTHIRCERVATNFATVCARVLKEST